MPVVTDPNRLVNYCCGSNYFVEGEDVKVSLIIFVRFNSNLNKSLFSSNPTVNILTGCGHYTPESQKLSMNSIQTQNSTGESLEVMHLNEIYSCLSLKSFNPVHPHLLPLRN